MLDINMATPFSGDTVEGHIDSRHIVFTEWSATILKVSDFQKDSTYVFKVLGSYNSSKELDFPYWM